MAIYSSKKTSLFPKGINDKAERGISSSRRSKTTPSAQQFSGVASRNDRNTANLSNRAKKRLVFEHTGPRRRPKE